MIALPRYAPLSTPFILHLLDVDEEDLRAQLQKTLPGFLKQITIFERVFFEVRSEVFALMNEDVLAGMTSIDWFRGLVGQRRGIQATEERSLVSKQTIKTWRSKGLLGTDKRGTLNLDAVGAMLIASAMAKDQVRGFHPSSIHKHEPLYYCYSQSNPEAPWEICPVPLPDNLPGATLLWTPWPTWDSHWLQIGHYGAIRWAGAMSEKNGSVRWILNRDELACWNKDVRELDVLFASARALHNQADTELLKLARGRLTPPPLLLEEAYFNKLHSSKKGD